MMAVAILSGVHYFLAYLDNASEIAMAERVALALSTESRYKRTLLEEYTRWDESYEKLIVEKDLEWINTYAGQHLLTSGNFDFSVVIDGGKPTFIAKTSQVSKLTVNAFPKHELSSLIQQSQTLKSSTKTLEAYFLLDDDIYWVIVGPLFTEREQTPKEKALLLLGQKIDIRVLEDIADNYQLLGLSLDFSSQYTKRYLPLLSPTGGLLAQLSWEVNLPSKMIFYRLVFIALIFFALAVLVAWTILIRAHKDRSAYELKLYEEATTDALTKLKNRRYFMEYGENEQQRHLCQGKSLCLLLLDIDHFKHINDTYGHNTGDEALKHFVSVCGTMLRKTDTFGRLGGEEFAVLLPEANLEDSLYIANRILSSIKESPLNFAEQTISMTVSIGLVELKKQPHFKDLIEHADQAMYQAKNSGRDTIQTYRS